MSRVADRSSNFFDYHYYNGQGEFYLEGLVYSGNEAAGIAPMYNVEFIYIERPDHTAGYIKGTLLQQRKLLTKINVLHREESVRSFNLQYSLTNVTRVPKLASIQECGAQAAACFKPTEISWHDAEQTYLDGMSEDGTFNLAEFTNSKGWDNEKHARQLADLNGDGVPEIVGFKASGLNIGFRNSNGSYDIVTPSWNVNGFRRFADEEVWHSKKLYVARRQFIDLNDDGFSDILSQYYWIDASNTPVMVIFFSYNQGGSFSAPTNVSSFGNGRGLFLPGDVNNDGRVDLVKVQQLDGKSGNISNPNLYGLGITVFLQKSDGTFEATVKSTDFLTYGFPVFLHWSMTPSEFKDLSENSVYLSDFDQDGTLDLVALLNGKISVAYGDGFMFGNYRVESLGGTIAASRQYAVANVTQRQIIDVNADGLDDFVGFKSDGVYVALNRGNGFTSTTRWVAKFGDGVWDKKKDLRLFVDFNGDGFVDVLGSNSSGVEAALGTGQGFVPLLEKLYKGNFSDWSDESHSRILADVNGDNFIDLVAMGKSAFVATGHYEPTKISQVESGLGVITRLEYASLMDPAVYQQDEAPISSQVYSYRGPLYVVQSVEESDGRHGFNKREYNYSGMGIHKQGLGNLGFREQVVRDVVNNTIVTKTFNQDFSELTHTLLEKEVTLRDNRGVAQRVTRTIDWNRVVFEGALGQPNLRYRIDKTHESEVTEIREAGAAGFGLITANTSRYEQFDQFGYARLITTTTEDSVGMLKKVNNNTTSHDLNRWILNRLTSSLVDSRFTPSGLAHGQHLTAQAGRRTSSFTYDPHTGYLLSETSEPDSALWAKTTYDYDMFGQRISETKSWSYDQSAGLGFDSVTSHQEFDSTGRYVLRAYTPLSDTQSSFDSAVHKFSQTYDLATGLLSSVTDANGNTKLLSYDEFGRPTLTQLADGTWTNQSRSFCTVTTCPEFAAYFVVSVASDGEHSIAFFDQFNRVVEKRSKSLNGLMIATTTRYDSEGRIAGVSEPYFASSGPEHWINNHFDGVGRLVQVDSDYIPEGSDAPITVSKHIAYDGLSTAVTNEKGQTKVTWQDSQGLTIKVVDHLQNPLTHSYDVYGKLIATRDAHGNETLITYDLRGRKTSVDDPDKGVWTYQYNGMDLLYRQIDAKGQVTEYGYDRLARTVKRIDNAQLADGQSQRTETVWSFDAGHIGKLDVVDDGLFRESSSYDRFGRMVEKDTQIDGELFTTSFDYDDQGRVKAEHLPEGFSIAYHYNEYGFLHRLGNLQKGTTYWEAQLMDEHGNIAQYDLHGGAYRVNRIHDSVRGILRRAETIMITEQFLQDQAFEYDVLNNLTGREDVLDQVKERFAYDGLNRLVDSQTFNDQGGGYNLIKSVQVSYDALGNILSKSDVGTYASYGDICNGVAAGPHAVTSITGAKPASYCYDANGNMLSGAGRSLAYTSFDKPSRIVRGDNEVRLAYGPGRNRIQRMDITPNGSSTTTYLGHYERVVSGSIIQHKYYVGGNAVVTKQAGVADQTHYLLKDHLGSVNRVIDDQGNIVERRHFDAWGNRLAVNWNAWDETPDWYGTNTVTTRGFTGHEHLASVGLIHMNGRVYDPTIGRFIQADPIVQSPNDLQSLNRYAYVRNNPLSLIDPSGYSWLSKAWKSLKSFVKKWWRPIAAIAIVIVAPQFAPAFLGQFGAYAAAGFAAGYVSTGTLKGAVVGGLSATLFYGIGEAFAGAEMTFGNTMSKVWAHGLAGSAQSAALGGEAHAGFISAGFTQGFSAFGGFDALGVEAAGSRLWNASVAAVVGGTASALSGGKFANGAITGTFSRMFNDVAHAQNDGSAGGASQGRNPLSVVGDVLGKIWALPNTIIGAIYGGVGHVVGEVGYASGFYDVSPSITFGNNAIQFLDNPFTLRDTAITLGNTISYGRGVLPSDPGAYGDSSVNIGLHEQAHTYQYQVLGPLFLPTYLGSQIFSGSGLNAFENAAQNYGRSSGGWWPQ